MARAKRMKDATHEELQMVFDEVLKHLLKQGRCHERRSPGGAGGCRYRSGGKMCAAGFLISDEKYQQCFEGRTADDGGLIVYAIEASLGFHLPMGFACRLQQFHDDSIAFDHTTQQPTDLATFRSEADRIIALHYGLKVNV